MKERKLSPRVEYRLAQSQRVKESVTLAEKFRELKALTVDLTYSDEKGHLKPGTMKYTVNPVNGKSLFRIDCPNQECVAGDFDLSAEIAATIAAHRTTASGEITCAGWRSKTEIGNVHCGNVLHYKFSVGYNATTNSPPSESHCPGRALEEQLK
jgi:hypothetical protein